MALRLYNFVVSQADILQICIFDHDDDHVKKNYKKSVLLYILPKSNAGETWPNFCVSL